MTETVTQKREPESKSGMGVVGWTIFLGMVILLLPLVPLYLLLKFYNAIVGETEAR